MRVRICNLTRTRVPTGLVQRVCRRAFRLLDLSGEFEIIVAGSRRMRAMNVQYRLKDRPADVLSFSYPEGTPRAQIFISAEAAKEPDKLTRLLVHAIVHIKGFNHRNRRRARQMEKVELKILKNLSS